MLRDAMSRRSAGDQDLQLWDSDIEEWLGDQMNGDGAAELHLFDSDLEDWLSGQASEQGAALHVLIGDSIARDAPFRVRRPDQLLRLTTGGMTWARLPVERHLHRWREEASTRGLRVGVAVVFLTGNDVYARRRGAADLPTDAHWDVLQKTVVRCVAALAAAAERVILLGPLPRFATDAGKPWERTAAYHLERHVGHWISDLGMPNVSQVDLGRRLTHRVKKRHVVNSSKEFRSDGLHLSEYGYHKISAKVPEWLLQE